jgi:hypothetical protein
MVACAAPVSCVPLDANWIAKWRFEKFAGPVYCDLLDGCGVLERDDTTLDSCLDAFAEEYYCAPTDNYRGWEGRECLDELLVLTCREVGAQLDDVAPSCGGICVPD